MFCWDVDYYDEHVRMYMYVSFAANSYMLKISSVEPSQSLPGNVAYECYSKEFAKTLNKKYLVS